MANRAIELTEQERSSLLGIEDELSGPSMPWRITPQTSLAEQENVTAKPTPYASLRLLAGMLPKPSTGVKGPAGAGSLQSGRKAIAAEPTLHARTTPGARRALHPISGSNNYPSTPHAIRALKHRRATPGHDRRKSGRLQRETPRDILRNLSKLLALSSKPTEPPVPQLTADMEPKEIIDSDVEDELSLQAPRFSIPIEDEDSFHLTAPRLSMPLEDLENSPRSIEVARRAPNREMLGRLSRGSFGSTRTSDHFDTANEMGLKNRHSVVLSGLDGEDTLGDFTRLADFDGGTEDLRRAVLINSDYSERQSIDTARGRDFHTESFSPFALQIPNFASDSPLRGSLERQDSLRQDPIHEHPLQVDHLYTSASPIAMEQPSQRAAKEPRKPRKPKTFKNSRHGIPYPSVPMAVTKGLALTYLRATGKRKSRLNKETLSAIVEAGDRFFEQLSGDLAVYATHAGRKRIDENDLIAVMRRQRQISTTATAFSLAQKHLPGELLQDVRVPKPILDRQRRNPRLKATEEEEEDDVL